jgi:hypothetical protein
VLPATTAHQDFKECTEQYQSQVVLELNGALKNFVCGQPFAVTVEDRRRRKFGAPGGLELQLRWQNYGLIVGDVG